MQWLFIHIHQLPKYRANEYLAQLLIRLASFLFLLKSLMNNIGDMGLSAEVHFCP